MERYQLEISGKSIELYPSAAADRPIVYLNSSSGEGQQIYEALRELGCPELTLVVISRLNWNHDLAPWDAPPAFKKGAPFTSGADEYLQLLTQEILPEVEEKVAGNIPWRGLAGYSLAGLFALYALYGSERFSRAASISGSLWFPGFQDYAFSQKMKSKVEHLYLSLGDKECRTRNPMLRTVQENTETLSAFYQRQGIDTVFRLVPGNHFQDPVQRTAAGIAWLLSR